MDTGANLITNIFSEALDFDKACLDVFRFQYHNNKIYQKYVDALGVNVLQINRPENIPFLPIRFFKSHEIVSTQFEPDLIFESSGTTQTVNSRHLVKSAGIY